MITKITAVGLKGLDFSYDLSKHNLITGPNGVGKSAITDALILTIEGRIPGAGKTNQAVMDAFATNDKMYVGVISNDIPFERRFIRAKSGKVTQKFLVSNQPVTKEQFIAKFAEAGKPAVLNLSDFMATSDEKKIDRIFSLYPPEANVKTLQIEIDTAQEALNNKVASIKKTEDLIEALNVEKSSLDLPAGTLAEVQKEIERTTKEVGLARDNLKRQIVREATKNAEKKAEAEKEKSVKPEREDKEVSRTAETPSLKPDDLGRSDRPQLGCPVNHTARNSEDFQEPFVHPDDPGPEHSTTKGETPKYGAEGKDVTITHGAPGHPNPKESINSIMDMMIKAGCGSCAAMLQCKKELHKY